MSYIRIFTDSGKLEEDSKIVIKLDDIKDVKLVLESNSIYVYLLEALPNMLCQKCESLTLREIDSKDVKGTDSIIHRNMLP